MVERFAAITGIPCLVFPVADVPPTPRFGEHLLAAIAMQQGGPELTPENTIVACSTPAVIELFRELGFRILGVELETQARRPWETLEALVAAGSLDAVEDDLHPAAVELYRRYDLAAQVLRVHADPLLSDEGELTETRDYNTYARAFDTGAARKWAQLREWVRPGRIVDVGCGVGSLLREIAADAEFAESDLYGIEAARPLYEECVHRRAQGAFEGNPNTFFFQRTIGEAPLFPDASIDTTLSVALCHELWSYIGPQALRTFLRAVAAQTAPDGVWVLLDVLGPEGGDEIVWLELAGEPELASWRRFCEDWRPERVAYEQRARGPGPLDPRPVIETKLRWAMEWLSKKDYTDNWLSEMHESFCFWSYSDWLREVGAAGLEPVAGSTAIRNDWLVENRFATAATLRPRGEPDQTLPWPDTHIRLVCRPARSPGAPATLPPPGPAPSPAPR